MITLYTWATTNGRKASIMLEEIGAPYCVQPLNIYRGEQCDPAYLEISPNHTIPAIVDYDATDGPRTVFESGAVLIYLAEKSGQLLAPIGRRRDEALGWLLWASSGFAAAHGQWRHFAERAEQRIPTEIERCTKYALRMIEVLERRLNEQPYLAQDYSIADVAAFTRARAAVPAFRNHTAALLGPTPGIDRWLAAIEARAAVKRGLEIPKI
jgi:GST-like protein